MERLDRKIRNVWISISAFTGIFIGMIFAAITFAATDITAVANVAFLIFPVIFSVYSYYRYQNWFFKVHEDHLEINHGVLRKTSAVVPYVRVQHIDTNRGPLERVLGLASLRVYTAGSKGADMRIPGLARKRAEEMQEELKSKAIQSEKGFDAV
ncbi:MAG: PH domain-containing protein [Candidatus Nanohaloarchaea archaeon]